VIAAPRQTRTARLAAWWGRQQTVYRLVTFGRGAVASEPHEPLPDPAWPGVCGVDDLDLDDPLHQRRNRRRKRQEDSRALADRSWR
jgi:hypothetical protein